jgi:hypothetical protein
LRFLDARNTQDLLDAWHEPNRQAKVGGIDRFIDQCVTYVKRHQFQPVLHNAIFRGQQVDGLKLPHHEQMVSECRLANAAFPLL